MTGNLQGRTVFVTGATRGLGRAIAESIAAQGASVIVSGRDGPAAEAAAAEIAARHGVRAAGIAAELTDDAAVDTLIKRAIAVYGKLDVLVNNAGIDADAPAVDHKLEDFRRVMKVNLEVPFRLTQDMARHLLGRGAQGVVLNIASIAGSIGVREACSYSASKHGLIGLTKTFALEWGQSGIRVCGIAPGVIKTDMTEYIWTSEPGQAYIRGRIPMGRIGEPGEIGALAAFLVSDGASFIHGETVVCDGGTIAG